MDFTDLLRGLSRGVCEAKNEIFIRTLAKNQEAYFKEAHFKALQDKSMLPSSKNLHPLAPNE